MQDRASTRSRSHIVDASVIRLRNAIGTKPAGIYPPSGVRKRTAVPHRGRYDSAEEDVMTWKDKLEIGLKNDAPFRKDNLAPDQVHGPEIDSGPGRSPVIPEAQDDREHAADRVPEDELTDSAPKTE
jgi:hypothetical protein